MILVSWLKNCDANLLKELEPWCSTIYVDCEYNDYIKEEQRNTAFDLSDRVKPYDNEKNNNIIVEFDAKNVKC